MSASAEASRERDPLRGSVSIPPGRSKLRRFMAFLGPGYLVATGYMDPGNWATSIAAGSRYGMTLLFVVTLSSLMAIVLQALAARLGLGAGLDLAQACRAYFPRKVAVALWVVAEAGIIATDLAELIGSAIGLQLLFGLPLAVGAVVTLLDAFLVLALERAGFRKVELFVVAMIAVIALSFTTQLVMARPSPGAVALGLLPTPKILADPQMLYLALGVIGATVMPHNLFLHSSIVQTRAVGQSAAQRREAILFAQIDSGLALFLAMFVNAAILILASAAFFSTGHREVVELGDAYRLIAPLLGSHVAQILFAAALIACGLNSTVTATLTGQVVMEGFLRLRMRPTPRRLATRGLAILPALATTILLGEAATGRLLVLSQAALSFALPFALAPLIYFTASRKVMGEFVAPRKTSALAALIAAIIILLNVKLLIDLAF